MGRKTRWPACVRTPKTLTTTITINHDQNITSSTNIKATSHNDHKLIDHEEGFSSKAILYGLRSERLFFEPGETNSILELAKKSQNKETTSSISIANVAIMDSTNPFIDFRDSMAEMVEDFGLKEWESLEELLTCYLRVNERSNHGYIVGAFVDLLLILAMHDDDDDDDDEHCGGSSTSSFLLFLQWLLNKPMFFLLMIHQWFPNIVDNNIM